MDMEAVRYSETLITTYQTATCSNLENHNIDFHDLETLKFQILLWLFGKRVNSSEAGRVKNRAV
jgi:hypothetical protein